MLELRHDVKVSTQVSVLPQIVARASLLELSQEELEHHVREKVDENPVLELTRIPSRGSSAMSSQPMGAAPDEALARLPAPTSLRDDLLWQLRLTCGKELLSVAQYIIENLDERGYLAVHPFEIADDLAVPERVVEEALEVVHELEPRGVGARDLAECLLIQVNGMRSSEVPEGMVEFLEGEFAELVRANDLKGLASPQTPGATTYLAFIRDQLYPYPQDAYRPPYPTPNDELPAHPPDVVVGRDDTRFIVNVPLSERLALRVDGAYESLARSMDAGTYQGDSATIKRLLVQAKELIANITHRHTVMSEVAAAIIEEQMGFFEHGPGALKPCTKKELAQKLEMHESTVCRATRGKSMMLPDGEVVPFDVFFEDALPIKVALAGIISRESTDKPLTDCELADELEKVGYPVARRTVSKYRASLGIPTASRRRS